jgi:hypothetical protein
MAALSKTLTLTINKKQNVLDGITCYEPVEIEILDKLLKTDLLINNFKNPITRDLIGCEEKQLKRYKCLIDRETNLSKINYERVKGMSYGRSNPKGALGMFSMRKKMRHTLAKRVGLSDWDIVNAHPEFLLQICKANGLACDKLEHYVTNRDSILGRLMTITNCNRDRAKELFIRLLFFGSFSNWLKEKKDDKGNVIYQDICLYAFQSDLDFTAYIDELTTQLKQIGEHIAGANPKLVKEVEKNKELKKKKSYNKIGSVVSFYLQEWEIRVLECIYQYCCENGYIVNNICVLSADGIMLEDELIKDANILVEFNTVVKEKIGFNLRFSKKELDECLTDEDIDNHILTSKSLDRTMFDRFNPTYFNSLIGYNRKKIYFEIFVCKVVRPDPCFIYIERENDIEVLNFYNQSKIIEAFNHLKTGEVYDNGEEVKFMTKWVIDENIRFYNKMDFIPFNDKTPTPDYIFNLFRGFSDKRNNEYDYSKREKLLKPFKDLGLQLCGGDEKHFKYLYAYLADIIQNPNKKNPIAFIIKGKQGTGKNMFLNAFGNIIGKQHYITSSNPKDFFGDYAEGFYHKLLVNMNECEGKDTFDFEGRIKSFITEDTITLNRKFVQPITIANLARLIIFSNKSNPIPIDVRSKDRRYVVYETTDKYLDNKYGTQFWKMLNTHFNRPDFIACLYDDLNELDLTNMDWKADRPITKAYIQMCRLYVPTEVLFLQHKIVKALENDINWEVNGITGQELFKDYTAYCKEFGFCKDGNSTQKNIKCFYSKLRELELPFIEKNPQNIVTFYFNVNEVLKTMKDKKWIDRSDEDFENETTQEVKGDDFTEYFDI